MTASSTGRTAIIAGNWKMNYGPREAAKFVQEIQPALAEALQAPGSPLCILCPPAISLAAVRAVLDIPDAASSAQIELGAQNMYFEEKGAFTGEISPNMVHELCTTVILGHSERRTYFSETDELVNKKTLAALRHGLRPVVCIGENVQQHESGETAHVITTQIRASLANLTSEQAREIVIAYEPIWAIGTGKAATGEIANNVIRQIRQEYQALYGAEAASVVRILYGGSVTSDNIAEFMAYPDIDGALVGGASLKPDFVNIVRNSRQVRH